YASTNSGATWSRGLWDFGPLAFSADGVMVLGVNCPSSSFYVSVDSGITWTLLGGPVEPWQNVALAVGADGNQLVAVINGGGIYVWKPIYPQIVGQPQGQIVLSGTELTLT